jgi:hypothetical protein
MEYDFDIGGDRRKKDEDDPDLACFNARNALE